MPVSHWKKRFALAALTTLVALVILLLSQHRIRLIIGSYEAIDSNANLPAQSAMTYMVSPAEDAPRFSKAVSILSAFDNQYPLHPGDALATLDDPDTCELALKEGRRLHCYNDDIGACTILAKQNIQARLWDMSGPYKLGGYGHNMLEVFDGQSRSWKAIDPYYHSYFTRLNDSIPLSFPALRFALLTSPKSIRIVHYSDTAGARSDTAVFSELRFLAPAAMLHANNDFRSRYNDRYAWLTPVAGRFIDALPLRAARGVRMLMLGANDRRYIIEDSHGPHYPFVELKLTFWLLLLMFFVFLIGALVTRPQENRDQNSQATEPNASRKRGEGLLQSH